MMMMMMMEMKSGLVPIILLLLLSFLPPIAPTRCVSPDDDDGECETDSFNPYCFKFPFDTTMNRSVYKQGCAHPLYDNVTGEAVERDTDFAANGVIYHHVDVYFCDFRDLCNEVPVSPTPEMDSKSNEAYSRSIHWSLLMMTVIGGLVSFIE